MKAGVRNFRFRCRVCQLDWSEESGASPADQRGHRGEVSQRPQESELGTAGPPSFPEEDPREPPVGTAETPDQVTVQRNRFRLPPQALRGMLGMKNGRQRDA